MTPLEISKPLGTKLYGSIPHLSMSKRGPADHHCSPGQERIATVQVRDARDFVIVQEKLDGSNVGVAKLNGQIVALVRAGYLAETSPYLQHRVFAAWARANADRFLSVLNEGERLVGEWLLQAHGNKYTLWHEPFVAFDLIRPSTGRALYTEFYAQLHNVFISAGLVCGISSVSLANAQQIAGFYGYHGAQDPIEGFVWRVERHEYVLQRAPTRGSVDFLVKYVRPDYPTGQYLPLVTGGREIWNDGLSDELRALIQQCGGK